MNSMYGALGFHRALRLAKLYPKVYPIICKIKKGEATLKDIFVGEALIPRAEQGFLETSRDNFYK